MAVVMRTEGARDVPAATTQEALAQAETALDQIVAAHREALLALAPHQEDRAARLETGWHMERLGVLLCVRDATCAQTPPHPALDGLRAGQGARVQAALAYREAGGDPVEEIMTLLPRAQGEEPLRQQKAPPSMVPDQEGPRESTGTDRLTH